MKSIVLKSIAIKAMPLMQKKFVSVCSFQPCFGFGRAVLKAAKKQKKIPSLKKKLNIFKGIEISFKNWGLCTWKLEIFSKIVFQLIVHSHFRQ